MAYSQEEINKTFESILKDIESGMSLRQSLRQPDRPSSQTFYLWLDEDNNKSKQYARACDDRHELIFDEILDIADENNADATIVDGKVVIDGNIVQRSRLKIDARKWMLGKMNPKKYGDKSEIEHTVKIGVDAEDEIYE